MPDFEKALKLLGVPETRASIHIDQNYGNIDIGCRLRKAGVPTRYCHESISLLTYADSHDQAGMLLTVMSRVMAKLIADVEKGDTDA